MEELLILALIVAAKYGFEALAKKARQGQSTPKSNNEPEEDDFDSQDYDSNESKEPSGIPKSLEDLIRQYERAQGEAEVGNLPPPIYAQEYVPEEPKPVQPPPPPPKPKPTVSVEKVIETIVKWHKDVVTIQDLQDCFVLTTNQAKEIVIQLQARHILGRDMGYGEYSLMVHSKQEADNIKVKPKVQIPVEKETSTTLKKNVLKEDLRRGFIWAKIIDEPRFKKRWSAKTR